MKTKKLYISPAMRAHKLKLQACILDGSNLQKNDNVDRNKPTDETGEAKSSRFSAYDGFGNKSEESSSDAWK